jgi:hypothetical protein
MDTCCRVVVSSPFFVESSPCGRYPSTHHHTHPVFLCLSRLSLVLAACGCYIVDLLTKKRRVSSRSKVPKGAPREGRLLLRRPDSQRQGQGVSYGRCFTPLSFQRSFFNLGFFALGFFAHFPALALAHTPMVHLFFFFLGWTIFVQKTPNPLLGDILQHQLVAIKDRSPGPRSRFFVKQKSRKYPTSVGTFIAIDALENYKQEGSIFLGSLKESSWSTIDY